MGLGNATLQTKHKRQTLNPVWNEDLVFDVSSYRDMGWDTPFELVMWVRPLFCNDKGL